VEAGRDPKWRFRWIVDHPSNVIPPDFPEFECVMNEWGRSMRTGCLAVAEMIALGLGVEQDFLYRALLNGPFYLSPTATNLQKTKEGQVIGAFHRDFDLLTIHGKANFPGLFAWLTTGERFSVSVPEGHLLVQAGKQLEWLTGGHIKAGFHEIVYTSELEKARRDAEAKGRPQWRISSTMFGQAEDSVVLEPHPKFLKEAAGRYPRISAAEYLKKELYSLNNAG
jgi:isopenicillin N synthase-like dioxygenase